MGLVVLYEICILVIGTGAFVRKGDRVVKSKAIKDARKHCVSAGALGGAFILMLCAAREVVGWALYLQGMVSHNLATSGAADLNFATFMVVMIILLAAAGLIGIITYFAFNLGGFLQRMWLRYEIRKYPMPKCPRISVTIVDGGDIEAKVPHGEDCPTVTLNADDLKPLLRQAQMILTNTRNTSCLITVKATVGDLQAPNITDRGRRMLADFLQAQEKAVDAEIPCVATTES